MPLDVARLRLASAVVGDGGPMHCYSLRICRRHVKQLVAHNTRVVVDRIDDVVDLIPVCVVRNDEVAHMYNVVVEGGVGMFVGPPIVFGDVKGIMLGGNNDDVSHIELCTATANCNGGGEAGWVEHFVPYYGPIETSCLYIPQKDTALKEQERQEGAREYTRRKSDTLRFLLGIIGVGAITCTEVSGIDSAVAFASGGMLGVVYQMLLHYEVDKMGTQQLFVNTATRLGLVVGTGILLGRYLEITEPGSFFMTSTMGFMMQKLAMWMAFTI